jgi:hypothetical protein
MKTTIKQVENAGIELSVLAENYREKQMLLNANDTFKDIMAKNGKAECELIIKKIVKKRTLDQNNFMWELLTEFAKFTNGERVTDAEVEELYVEQLRKWTLPEKNILLLEKSADTFIKHLKPRFYKIVGYTQAKGEQYVYLDIWFGSSNFNTKEMANLINGILDDMEIAGINTQEFIKMTKEWREFEKAVENGKHNTKK